MAKQYVFIAALFIIVIGIAFWSVVDDNVDNFDAAQGTKSVGVSWAHTPTTTTESYDDWLYFGHTNGTGIVSCTASSLSGVDENVTIGHNSVDYGHVFVSDGSDDQVVTFESNNNFADFSGAVIQHSNSTEHVTQGTHSQNMTVRANESFNYIRTLNSIDHDAETNYTEVWFDLYIEDVDDLFDAAHGARFSAYQGSTAYKQWYFADDLVDGANTVKIDLTETPDASAEDANMTDITAYRLIMYSAGEDNMTLFFDNLRLATGNAQSSFTVENIAELSANSFNTQNTVGNFTMSCSYSKPHTAESSSMNLLNILVLLIVVLVVGLIYKMYREAT